MIITGFAVSVGAFITLEKELVSKLDSKKFLAPTEFYSAPPIFYSQSATTLDNIQSYLKGLSYRQRESDQRLLPGDYLIAGKEECTSRFSLQLDENITHCLAWVTNEYSPENADKNIQLALFAGDHFLAQTLKGKPFQDSNSLTGEAKLIAQYIDSEPLLQKTVNLGQVPSQCLNAILSIEDAQFLEHGGVSLKGIGRALFKNLTSGRKAQGGSTITQQLVKNYFLTSERTLKRKFNEFIMSILLEARFSKDEILETYLNIIYMGQSGSFQVRGYGAAAQYYFAKNIEDLNLSECSLLAAIVNSPGLFNPFKRPENATKRRSLVLQKMNELGYISETEASEAKSQPLPQAPRSIATETAPYYLDAVRKQLIVNKISPDGLKIYTGLDLDAQVQAQAAVRDHLSRLEKNNKHIEGLKKKGLSLEGVLLSANNDTGIVSAVVGGRDFRMTQFNRAIDGHRQIGSIMKPFVFLTALINSDEDGQPFTPITLLNDEKFTHKYQGQSWSPVNYGGKYFGTVPMFYALKNSLNAATASLGIQVGLGNIVEVTQSMGVSSPLKSLPAMTLGAFEMYPVEVLKSYMAMANYGKRQEISFIRRATTQDNEEVFTHDAMATQVIDPTATASLVSMMRQTILSGSARYATLNGFTTPAAGKTGTTSDNKDAWFAGFTPALTTVVWVGYDNNTPHKLTGASGAVPAWTQYMKAMAARYPSVDFPLTENSKVIRLNTETLKALNALRDNDPPEVELVFDKRRLPAGF